jgi:hypothetical protein
VKTGPGRRPLCPTVKIKAGGPILSAADPYPYPTVGAKPTISSHIEDLLSQIGATTPVSDAR